MAPSERHRHDPHRVDDVDAALRRLLEPNPLAVERLVRSALAEESPRAAPRRWPRLAVAVAALVALLVVLIPDSDVPPPEPSAAAPARISISNADGFVTVSSAAGSQWILVPGGDS